MYQRLDDIVENIGIFVCFMTPINQVSKECQEQVKFAKTKRIPIIACRLLPDWKSSGWLNQPTLLDDPNMLCLVEYFNSNCMKKKPYKHRILPKSYRLSLSNLMIGTKEYTLIHANNHLHLFDGNLKYIRSNNERKIQQQ
ncbi:unnamed protein product, partial [Rotaria sp. Silwood2]